MLNWLFRKKKKEDPNLLALLEQSSLLNRTLLDSSLLLQQRYEQIRIDFIIWLGAATLQSNGELILKKDFIDAIATNLNLTLKIDPTDDGDLVITLVDKINE